MRLLPASLGVRLALAGLAALVAIVVLERCATRAAARAAVRPATLDLPPDRPALRGLAPGALVVRLVGPGGRWDDAAPVLAVTAAGELQVRRPPPRPDGPLLRPAPLAAVLVPGASLADLTPGQRAALLDVLSVLCRGRPDPAAIDLAALHAEPADLAALLRWLR